MKNNFLFFEGSKVQCHIILAYIIIFTFIFHSSSHSIDQLILPIEDGEPSNLIENLNSFEVDVSQNSLTLSEILKTQYKSSSFAHGITSYVDFRLNSDGETIDVLWVDAQNSRHLVKVSLIDKKVIKEIPIPSKANTGRFLGFEKYGENKYIIAFSTPNSHGDEYAEAWYSVFTDDGQELNSTRIFGDVSFEEIGSKGNPSQVGSAFIRYNKEKDVYIFYLLHHQKWLDNTKHQGGYFGTINSEKFSLIPNLDKDGKEKTTESGVVKSFDNGRCISHKFDILCIVSSDSMFYTLAHGDVYPRTLVLKKWSLENENKEMDNFEYYKIKKGASGNNKTLSNTGDFTDFSNWGLAINYSNENGREQRDLRVAALLSRMKVASKDNPLSVKYEIRLTTNKENIARWGRKTIQYGDKISVGRNLFVDKRVKSSSILLLDMEGNILTSEEKLEETIFYSSQLFYKTVDRKKCTICFC